MSETTGSTSRAALRECPRCAEPVAADETVCGFCGQPVAPRKPALTRLVEVTSLAVVLAVIVLVCRVIGDLIGV